MTCPHTTALGVYVLGALERDERAALEAHVGGCPTCRAELDRLTPLPGLLSRVAADEAAAIADERRPGEAEPPPAVLDAVLASIARERSRARRLARRRLALAAVAAVAIALAGAAGALLAGGSDDGRSAARDPARLTASAWNARGDVRAAVALRERGGRTRVTLRLAGVRPGQRCWLVARAAGGRAEVAARWRATYAGTAAVPGSVAMPLRDVVALDVVTPGGRRLVRVPLRGG